MLHCGFLLAAEVVLSWATTTPRKMWCWPHANQYKVVRKLA